ncbi:Acyl-CoA thioester hydrolase YbgC [Jannaschia seosinensis]|uniref:Acyl-CoA thioester hydrolase YbgC n=1 Tax=Jannaschia seosinensis TaxID=313367 RepID=A0A0M7B6N5_9RHOB|nr:thioesterase family protein [Jannaschia seosinensis]CUH25636.1 Acyl-CoA thioester hydrolase YbgC [Jannaschia seosinensis]
MNSGLPFLVPLDLDALRGAGVPEPFSFGYADRVRFQEIDVLDHVNNTRYLSWFETFRLSYLRAYGLGDYASETARPGLVLKGVSVDYHRPLHLEDVYVVAGRTKAYRNTSFTMEYTVWRDGLLCATSEAVLVLMEPDYKTKRALPETWQTSFTERDGATRAG